MKKIQKHIEIMCSAVPRLNSLTKKSCNAIYDTLARHYQEVGISIVDNLSDIQELVAKQPDLVFIGMKFVPLNPELGVNDPEKVWIMDILDECGIAYTGSSQASHELEYYKHVAKQRVLDAGLMTSPFCVVSQNQSIEQKDVILTYPVFIKPTNRGGGSGIDSNSVAHNFAGIKSKVSSLAAVLRSDSLVEQYLPGREFSVAILKDDCAESYVVMPLELIAPPNKQGLRFLSAQVKAADTESFAEVVDMDIKNRITTLALDVFHALGARDYGRIDIRLDAAGTPHFLEANLIPSLLRDYGNFPKACKLNLGMDYETMLLHIVRLGLAHSPIFDEPRELALMPLFAAIPATIPM